jgi:hypothetical protein
MGAPGKMMCGSGFEDIVIEAGLYASGLIEQVMSGKHYNHAFCVHQGMLDVLERMLLAVFNECTDMDNTSEDLLSAAALANEPSTQNLLKAEECDMCRQFVDKYDDFKSAALVLTARVQWVPMHP